MSKNIVYTMIKRHRITKDKRQNDLIEYLEATYLTRKKVSKQDLAIINKSELFPHSKVDRSYNNGVIHAKNDLKLLQFFLMQLKPKYRFQIIQSDEFQTVIQSVLDVSESRFHNLSKEEKDYARAFANQLLTYSLNVIVKTLPKPFVKLLKDSAMPLNNLLEAIYDFARENNIKDIPQFRKLAFPITSRDY